MTLPQLHQRRQELIAYLKSCVESDDYHGARDACTDIEVIAARIDAIMRERADALFREEPLRPPQEPSADHKHEYVKCTTRDGIPAMRCSICATQWTDGGD